MLRDRYKCYTFGSCPLLRRIEGNASLKYNTLTLARAHSHIIHIVPFVECKKSKTPPIQPAHYAVKHQPKSRLTSVRDKKKCKLFSPYLPIQFQVRRRLLDRPIPNHFRPLLSSTSALALALWSKLPRLAWPCLPCPC